ncbi:uncharacterized protein LOC144101487 [Amblyomma americanum]
MYSTAYNDPAAQAQAHVQHGYDPASHTEESYVQTHFDQTSFGNAPSEQATTAFQSTTSAVPKNKGDSSGKPVVLLTCAMLSFLVASMAITALVLWGGVGPEKLLCTYGRRTTSDAVMASDGLCDVAFYDSVYANNTNFLYGGSPFESDLVTFMRAATRYTRTTLGVAFAFQHMDRLGNDLRKTNPGPLELFWQSGIYHTGILDTPTNASRNQMTTAMYRLRELDNLGQSQRALGHQPLTVLAVPAPGKQWMYFLDEDFQRLQFIPNYIVVYGHYQFGDNTVDNCAVMPPTRLSAVALPPQLRTTYLYELTAGPQALRDLERKQVPTHGLLSVTMKGRWTTVYPGQPLDFFSRCELNPSATSFGSYAEVCKDRNYQYNLRYEPQHYAVLTYESTNRSAFTYDNEDGLAAKLCKVKYQERDVTFGIAAYDVDYDDYANVCGSINKFGENSRLKALRKIVDFYKNLGSQMFNEASCTSAFSSTFPLPSPK